MCQLCRTKKKKSAYKKIKDHHHYHQQQQQNQNADSYAEIDAKKEAVEKQLESFGFEVTKVFAAGYDYDPITYLNEAFPQDRDEHDHFVNKFQDGIYAIATPSRTTQHALLQVL